MVDKICKHCGTRLSYFYKTGMLGCPFCYEEFEDEIVSVVEKMQGKTYHVGKTPKCSEEDKRLLSTYKDLLSKKETAGIECRFSDMAKISKQIFDLTEELKKRGLI